MCKAIFGAPIFATIWQESLGWVKAADQLETRVKEMKPSFDDLSALHGSLEVSVNGLKDAEDESRAQYALDMVKNIAVEKLSTFLGNHMELKDNYDKEHMRQSLLQDMERLYDLSQKSMRLILRLLAALLTSSVMQWKPDWGGRPSNETFKGQCSTAASHLQVVHEVLNEKFAAIQRVQLLSGDAKKHVLGFEKFCSNVLELRTTQLLNITDTELQRVAVDLCQKFNDVVGLVAGSNAAAWVVKGGGNDAPYWEQGSLISREDYEPLFTFLNDNDKVRVCLISAQKLPCYNDFLDKVSNSLITENSQEFFKFGSEFNVADKHNWQAWYELLCDGRAAESCPFDVIRRSLLGLTSRRNDEGEHQAFVFASKDKLCAGHRSTALQIALSMSHVVRSSAQAISAWIASSNKSTQKVTAEFIKFFKQLKASIAYVGALEGDVRPTIVAIEAPVDGPHESSMNKRLAAFLRFYPDVTKIGSAILTGLSKVACDRIRFTLIDGSAAEVKKLYNDSWRENFLPGSNIMTRKENFVKLIVRNKKNHEAIPLKLNDLRVDINAMSMYIKLFDAHDLLEQAQAIETDAKQFTAVAVLLQVTVLAKAKLSDTYTQADLEAAAMAMLTWVQANSQNLPEDFLREYDEIVPDARTKSVAAKSASV